MILDPILAITSLDFYRRVAVQRWWRSTLYLFYISILFSLAGTIALKLQAGPHIDATFTWLKETAPALTFANGKISSPLTQPLTMHHPEFQQVALTIDTNRVEPITPKILEDNKVQAYLTSNAFYLMERPGQLRVYDFSKAADPKPVTIDAAFYASAQSIFNRILYPVVFAAGILLCMLWKACTTLLFALAGLLINALAAGGITFVALISIALYAQTAAIVLQALALMLPIKIPLGSLISMLITSIYLWLAIRKLRDPAPVA